MTMFLLAEQGICRTIGLVMTMFLAEQGICRTIGLVMTMFLAEQGICRTIGLVMTVFLARGCRAVGLVSYIVKSIGRS